MCWLCARLRGRRLKSLSVVAALAVLAPAASAAPQASSAPRAAVDALLDVVEGDALAQTSPEPTETATPMPEPQFMLHVVPDGADDGPCTAAEPCRTFDRAYRVAEPGDRVEVGGGEYSTQEIGVDASKLGASEDVVFEPAPGQIVTIDGNLLVAASHVAFRGSDEPYDFRVRLAATVATRGPSTAGHVTFENLDGASFSISATHHVTIKGGDWGPNTLCPNGEPDGTGQENKIGPDGNIPGQVPEDIVLDGLFIHDQNSGALNRDGLPHGRPDGDRRRRAHGPQHGVRPHRRLRHDRRRLHSQSRRPTALRQSA